ncbi:MAG TPA: ferritin-like domain-containing protein [Deltaproteobacteria bacterium]|jgi:bacterioferritin|nr:ferritin-like domain-containing protein [Deltaproteobacteria bacterium]HOI08390.1 ferritin-like domain-containing protein [Deltaproteobacteria bacterium]
MAKNAREERRKKVIDALNRARSMELHAIHEYMNQHYNLADMDYGDLAAKVKLIAIDEMRHAEMFAERIEELGGQPTTDLAQKVVKGQKVEVIFPFDVGLEDDAIAIYNALREVCRENGDSTSMKLFETIIDEEQIHLNYFDNIAGHIENLGQVYLAQVAGTPAESGPPARGFIAAQGGAA